MTIDATSKRMMKNTAVIFDYAASISRRRSCQSSEPKALLKPFPSEEMTCWPVSPRVGNVRNNDPSLIEPIAA